MTVPSNAGTLGALMAFASLLPWVVFSVLVARRLVQLGQRDQGIGETNKPPVLVPKQASG